MNTKYTNMPEVPAGIVYVRSVAVADLPQDVQDQVEGIEVLYSLHRSDGARLALVKDRAMAFALARQNDLAPVNVH
ncbi:DUF1150 family protein [Fertoebacter nigrum]|uniref:DUF1150 family protein n=1 Tax=Fertoeibacter niger TaxID=2656921 RepID=A0A8X8H1A5_9RHOB|nr:DUF1150 family protein [Fertoeibacter niger]NUB44399.1 DUF1150 family protein [Fertoeibacter niger]